MRKRLDGRQRACAICRKHLQRHGVKDGINVDHCHETGRVRGLLCRSCNGALGHFGDNIEGLRRALSYLDSNLKT